MSLAPRTSVSNRGLTDPTLHAKRRVLLVTNRYRTYHRRVLETLRDAFDFGIVWLSPAYDHDPVPPELLRSLRSWTLAEDPKRLTYQDLGRSAALFRFIAKEARGADLVIAPSAAAWKSKVIFAAARAVGAPVAFRSDVWREGDGLVRSTPSRPSTTARARLMRRATALVESRADGLLVPGSAARRFLEDRGIRADRIAEFPRLPLDTRELPLDVALQRELAEQKRGRVAFLYLGRVMHQKGLVPLIRAFLKVRATGREAMLFVVGGPIRKDVGAGKPSVDYDEEARELARADDSIVMFGNVDPTRVHNYYAASDVFVHPHVANVDGQEVFEPWGNVISEATSMRLPIIASDRIPAAFDLVETGRNGFLVPAEQLEGRLVDAMGAFVDNRAMLAEFGRASREKYDAFADPQRIVDGVESLIRRAKGHA